MEPSVGRLPFFSSRSRNRALENRKFSDPTANAMSSYDSNHIRVERYPCNSRSLSRRHVKIIHWR